MKDSELNEILQSNRVPERAGDFWEQFPGQVMAEARTRERSGDTRDRGLERRPVSGKWGLLLSRPALRIGLAVGCLVLGFVLGVWKGRHSDARELELAAVRKCFQEIEALFPNQLQAIIFDPQGARLVLAERADVPASPPLYLKIYGPKGCQRFVTFSGQQIRVNGDVCDVLVDRNGNVLLVGRQLVWSSNQRLAGSDKYQVEATPLERTL